MFLKSKPHTQSSRKKNPERRLFLVSKPVAYSGGLWRL
jgi:hypothetical protein